VSQELSLAQRRALDVLLEYEGWAVEKTELRLLALSGEDRSNLRSVVRGLLRRGMVHEWLEQGQRYYELDLLGWIRPSPLPPASRLRASPAEVPATVVLSLEQMTPRMVPN